MTQRDILPDAKRAVITGMGPVTPIGTGKEAFWQGLLAEKSAIKRLTRFNAPFAKAQCSAEIHDFSTQPWFTDHESRRWDRCTSFAMVGTKLALLDAGLEISDINKERVAISLGSALGGIADAEEQHRLFLEHGPKSVNRALALQIYGGSAHGNLAIQFGIHGPAVTHSNSCASANVAFIDALRMIREGLADVVIAGGMESPLSPLTFTAFDQIKTMSRWQGEPVAHACRPFDSARDGFVMGEGAAIFVIESLAHAKARNAHLYAEMIGSSLVSEAYHMTIPKPDGEPLRRAMQLALTDAAINASEIDYINAHASSTPQNDVNEAAQIANVFSPQAPPVSGTKAYTGHSLGAAGAMECAICLLAMEHQWLPPTLHHRQSDCEPLDYIPNHGRHAKVQTVLTNSFGFGGVDSCLIMRKI